MANYTDELSLHGIDPAIVGRIPVDITRIQWESDTSFLIEGKQGKFALWVYHGREASLAYQHQLLMICNQRLFPGFLTPILLADERTYVGLDERRWFYLTELPDMRKVKFGDIVDLKRIVTLIAGFRTATRDFGLIHRPERRGKAVLLRKSAEALKELSIFELLSRYRIRPTRFDQIYLEYLPKLKEQAQKALEMLETTEYQRLSADVTIQDMVINNFSRSNLRIKSDGQPLCLRFHDFYWELPIVDLALFLIKTGRSHRWGVEWFNELTDEYRRHYPISKKEFEIIAAVLSFPWQVYRLCNRYFFNQVDWPTARMVEKLERILDTEPQRQSLIASLDL